MLSSFHFSAFSERIMIEQVNSIASFDHITDFRSLENYPLFHKPAQFRRYFNLVSTEFQLSAIFAVH